MAKITLTFEDCQRGVVITSTPRHLELTDNDPVNLTNAQSLALGAMINAFYEAHNDGIKIADAQH